jgi:hypothetical protein
MDPLIKTPSGESWSGTLRTANLPPPSTQRWVVRRKASVIAAVRSGAITIEEACRTYQLSEEEFLAWQRAFETYGLAGLHVTRLKQYRASARGPRDVTEIPG